MQCHESMNRLPGCEARNSSSNAQATPTSYFLLFHQVDQFTEFSLAQYYHTMAQSSIMLLPLFVFCYFGVFVESLPPTINGPPMNVPAQLNGSTILQCTVSDASPVKWYRGSPFNTFSAIDPTDNSFSTAGSYLIITGFTNHHHGGDYFCKAESTSSKALLSCPGTVSQAEISTDFTSEPSDTNATIGNIAVLKCTPPVSSPPADVYWLKDDSMLLMDLSDTVQTAAGNLYLLNTTEEDSGYYQCVAKNTVTGETRYSMKSLLTIVDHEAIPEVESQDSFLVVTPSNKSVPLNGVAEFECFDNLNSETQWEWLGHASLPQTSEVDDQGVLVIFQVTQKLNGAVFRCSLPSRPQVASVEAHLTVTASPKPTIITSELSGTAGTSKTIFCRNQNVFLTGEVNAIWQVGGDVVKHEQTRNGVSGYTFDLPSGVSEIWVQCLMQDQYGCGQSSVSIYIEQPVVVPTLPPPLHILVSASPASVPLYISDSGILNLACNLIFLTDVHIPIFKFEWEGTNGQPFTTVAKTKSNQIETFIISVTLPGTYTCSVVSFFGGSSIHLTEAIVVSGVTVDTTTPTYSGTAISPTATSQSPTMSTDTVIPTPVQPASPPTNHPDNLSLTWIDNLLLVSWTHPPTQDNVDILGYKLNWGVVNEHLSKVALRAVSFDSPQFVIDQLNKNSNTEYQIMVWAYSIGGDGPSTVITTDQATELTDQPTQATTPTTNVTDPPIELARIMELGPCTSLVHSVASIGVFFIDYIPWTITDFDHYVISYSCDEAGVNGNSTQKILPTSVLLYDLQPDCMYNVTVSLVNGDGRLIAAPETCSFKTLEEEEISVTFNYRWVDSSSVSISWTLPPILLRIPGISIEVYYNGEWTAISDRNRLSVDSNETEIMIRIVISKSVIYSETISVPSQPRPSNYVDSSPSNSSSASPSINTPWVTYGLGFSAVILSITAALTLVLVMKHIQAKRRQENKNLKENSHKRLPSLSSQKSLFSSREDSMQSIKNKAPTVQNSSINNIYTS